MPLDAKDKIVIEETGLDPVANGELTMNTGFVKVFSSGGIMNVGSNTGIILALS